MSKQQLTRHDPTELDRPFKRWARSFFALALRLGACQKGVTVTFTTAATLVNQLMEARDEKRLLKLQAQHAAVKLLIIDELG